MNLKEITSLLESTHDEINTFISTVDETAFLTSPTDKWGPGGHTIHLRKSIEPLSKILGKPRFVIRYLFGKPNRAGRDYVVVKEKYYGKLANVPAGVTSPFVPDENDVMNHAKIVSDYKSEQLRLAKKMGKWKDKDLDRFILPHPLLGKITVREMLYFTDIHTKHHLCSIKTLCGNEASVT